MNKKTDCRRENFSSHKYEQILRESNNAYKRLSKGNNKTVKGPMTEIFNHTSSNIYYGDT